MEDFVLTAISFPEKALEPLVRKCFGDCKEKAYRILDPLVPRLNEQFRSAVNNGEVIISRGLFPAENPDYLSLESSLDGLKSRLFSNTGNPLTFRLGRETFEDMKRSSYPLEQIAEMKENGLSEGDIMRKIYKTAITWGYWCMSRMASNRRIGVVKSRGNHPDFQGELYEFKDMKELFPQYDRLKSYSLDYHDFLANASRDEVKRGCFYLVKSLRKCTQEGSSDFVKGRTAEQIREYAKVLGFNPQGILEKWGWKTE